LKTVTVIFNGDVVEQMSAVSRSGERREHEPSGKCDYNAPPQTACPFRQALASARTKSSAASARGEWVKSIARVMTRLRRDVAIKVLPADVATDPGRRARFEQEAHAAAALNHPNSGWQT